MKGFASVPGLILLCFGFLFAEEEESSRQRRRPRIRVYDESPRLIPVTPESESNQAARQDMERRIRQDRPLSSGLQSPGGGFSSIPSLIEPQWSPPQEESSGEEESSWINPLDFLSEEDLYETESTEETEFDEPEPEIDITAWENLQQNMIKETLTGSSEETLTREELAELTQRSESGPESEEDRQVRGIDLEPVAPLGSSELFSEPAPSRNESPERTDVSLFSPVLRMEPRGGELPAPEESGRPEMREFIGSRALFNQIKGPQPPSVPAERPDRQPERSFARPQFEPIPSSPPPARRSAVPLPGSGFSGQDARPGGRQLPGTVGASRISPPSSSEARPSSSGNEELRPSENRIRSRLSPAGGLGY